jgi:hypothetical protein
MVSGAAFLYCWKKDLLDLKIFKENKMLNFVSKAFRSYLNVLLWIILSANVVVGLIVGMLFSGEFSFLGLIVGSFMGLIIAVF